MKKIMISILICCMMFSSLFNTAYASEDTNHLDNEFYIYESEDIIYINHGESTTLYDTLTGNVYAADGHLVGCVFTTESENSIESMAELQATQPTTIEHDITIASRWTYASSTWSSAVIYEKTEAAIESVWASVVVAAGLTIAGVTGGWSAFLSIAVPAVIAAWEEEGPQKDSYYVYVRKYMYCSKYVLSQFGYVWQAYLEDYTAKQVLKHSIELTF